MATVETRCGTLTGLYENKVFVYKGVPYAKPPVNDRRWAPPQPRDPWNGARWAQRFAGSAPQLTIPAVGDWGAVSEDRAKQDEDCLHLNIWTPSIDHGSRPVMVWIHGGGFVNGSGAQTLYDGTRLAKEGDVVVVTINYRLGALGFLRLMDVTGGRVGSTGNEGLLDQIAALEWVRDNISAFGGNPDNVTIFGESAGGMSVGALLASPKAQGLFHKAILQSGAASTAQTMDEAADTAARLLHHLKLSGEDSHALYLMPPKALVEAAAVVSAETGRMAFQPVCGDLTLPSLPLECIKSGSADGIPVLVGATQHEWRLFSMLNGAGTELDETRMLKRLKRRVPGADLAAVARIYREILDGDDEPNDPLSVFSAIETDRCFRIPGIRLAETLAQRGQTVYQYLFTWQCPSDEDLGACHAIDLGFTFGTNGTNAGLGNFFGNDAAADMLSAIMRSSWTAFAHTGNPNNDRMLTWTPYSVNVRSTTLLGAHSGQTEAPGEDRRRVWNKYTDGDVIGFL